MSAFCSVGGASCMEFCQPPDCGQIGGAFPLKTLEMLGCATGAGRSTVKRWLNGECEPPAYALALCTAELMRRLAGQ